MATKWYIDLGEDYGFGGPYESFDLAAEQVAWALIRGFGADYQIEDAAGVAIGDDDGPHEVVARFETLGVAENDEAAQWDAELVLTIDAPAHVPADLRAVARSAEPVVWVEYGPERSGARDMSTLYVQFNPEVSDEDKRYAEMELNPEGFSERTLVISAMAQELNRHDVPAFAVARMAHDLADAVENLNDESLQEICARNQISPKDLGTKIADGAMTTTAKRPSVLGTVDIPKALITDRPTAIEWTLMYDGRGETGSHPRPRPRKRNPAALTAKGERMYKHVLASINLKADATKKGAKTIAARTVVGAARRGVGGLVRKNPPLSAKRSSDFKVTGNYDVTDGATVIARIYRDPENGEWYQADTGEHYSKSWLGSTKAEAIERIAGRPRKNPSRGKCDECGERADLRSIDDDKRTGDFCSTCVPDAAGAIERYKTFHRYDPKDIGTFPASFRIPARLKCIGPAKFVTYRSGKVDPATGKLPKKPVNYIHEHDAGVHVYVPESDEDFEEIDGDIVDVPEEFREVTALAKLGESLGWCAKVNDGELEAENEAPLPDLYCSADGKCLYVIQGKREVLAMIWGGALGVFARGIDG